MEEKNIEVKLAKEYSFLMPSELFQKLPTEELKDLYIKEIERAFINGYNTK